MLSRWPSSDHLHQNRSGLLRHHQLRRVDVEQHLAHARRALHRGVEESVERTGLHADVAASEQQMEGAGMNTPAAQAVQDGPIPEARAAHGELVETAAEDPALVLAEQEAAIGNARADMETLQAQALAALQASRSGSVAASGTQQTDMVQDEVSQRETIAQAAEDKFTAAQTLVNDLLAPLPEVAMNMWNTGKERIATEFEEHLASVQRWVDDRHSGFGGGVVELWDDLTD